MRPLRLPRVPIPPLLESRLFPQLSNAHPNVLDHGTRRAGALGGGGTRGGEPGRRTELVRVLYRVSVTDTKGKKKDFCRSCA